MMEYRGVNHVALVCRDMKETVEFYTHVLEMPLVTPVAVYTYLPDLAGVVTDTRTVPVTSALARIGSPAVPVPTLTALTAPPATCWSTILTLSPAVKPETTKTMSALGAAVSGVVVVPDKQARYPFKSKLPPIVKVAVSQSAACADGAMAKEPKLTPSAATRVNIRLDLLLVISGAPFV